MSRSARRAAAALLLVVLAALALHGLRLLARSRTVQVFGRLVHRVDTAQRVVALTFDDGPTAGAVDEILRPLAERGAKATFFVVGEQVQRAPEALRKIVAAGHQVGNHSFSHRVMVLKSPSFVRRELDDTDRAIREAGFAGPIRFRPPNGYKLVVLPWLLQRTGRTSVTWDVEPDSWRGVREEPARIAEHVAENARPGSIVLLHPWYRKPSRDAIPAVVDALRARGFRLVTVDELLALRETL